MARLFLSDSFSRNKVAFAPQDPSRVTIYCCGPTVYAEPHIGNARAAIVADQLVRTMRAIYGDNSVIFARNFTDIDDKIMNAAREEGVDISVITERAIDAYHAGLDALGCVRPDLAPKATDFIDEMQVLISKLFAAGHAYAGEGHVLFDTQTFDNYGALSGLDRDSILAGARVEVAPYKKDAADFVLWKPSADHEPGWDVPSDWPISGRGRPGWHLECSAMIRAVLGETIDIHMGGQDLRFPHHENEIAQSCCADDLGGVPLARYWLHNGMLRFGGEKMSKSLGNIQTPKSLMEDWPGEVLRFALLTAHYRQPLEWNDGLLESCKTQMDRFYRAIDGASPGAAVPEPVIEALADDLNTPQAIAALHALRDQGDGAGVLAGGQLLGLFGMSSADWFQGGGADDLSAEDIDAQIVARQEAKANRDFAEADRIRDALAAQGVVLEDGPAGATWRRG